MREDKKIGKRTKVSIFLILFAIPCLIFFGIFFLNDRSASFIALCIIGLAMIPFCMIFEDRKPQAREVLLIAVMAAIAVVGRMAFFMLPQFKMCIRDRLALDSKNYEIPKLTEEDLGKGLEQTTREKLIQQILDKQLSDGGWALSGTK